MTYPAAGDAAWAGSGGTPGSKLNDFLSAVTGGGPSSTVVDVFNVLTYGATGNGTTDDTAAIQATIDASTLGSTIYFPTGTYLISTTIKLLKGRWYEGAGKLSAVLKMKNATNLNAIAASETWLSSSSVTSDLPVQVYNLGFDGNKANQASGAGHGLALISYDTVVENVEIINPRGTGLLVTTKRLNGTEISSGTSNEQHIFRVTVRNPGAVGIYVEDPTPTSNNAKYGWMRDCVVESSVLNGIEFDSSIGWNISGNRVSLAGQSGIALGNAGDTVVSSNIVEGFGTSTAAQTYGALSIGDYSTYISGSGPITCTGNRLSYVSGKAVASTVAGIVCFNADSNTASIAISGNSFRDATAADAYGVFLWNAGASGVIKVSSAGNKMSVGSGLALLTGINGTYTSVTDDVVAVTSGGGGGTSSNPIATGTATVDVASIAAGGIATFEIPVVGALAGQAVAPGPPSSIEAGLIWGGIAHGASGAITAQDNFNDNSTNTGYWVLDSPNGSATATETGATMVVTMPSSATVASHAGYTTIATNNNLTGKAVSVAVLGTFLNTTNAQTILEVSTADYNNGMQIRKQLTSLEAWKIVAGVFTRVGTSVAYNSTTMKYWRIREASGTTYWEYSSDTSSWTVLTSAANPVSVTAFQLRLYGSCWQNETNAGTATFDDFVFGDTATVPAGVTMRLFNTTAGAINPASATWRADVVLDTVPPSSPAVGSMAVTSITSSSANVSWTAPTSGSTPTNYSVGWVESGTGRTWQAFYALSASPLALTGLIASTGYVVSVTPYYSGVAGSASSVSFTTTASSSATLNEARQFNGTSNYLEVPNNASFSIKGGGDVLSVEAWLSINVSIFPTKHSSGDRVYFMGKNTSGQSEWVSVMYDSTTTGENRPWRHSGYTYELAGSQGNDTYWQPGLTNNGIVGPNMQLNVWEHYAYTYNLGTNTAKIYRNGVLMNAVGGTVTGSAGTLNPQQGTAPFRMGTTNLQGYWAGKMGFVALYKSELSVARILSHYNTMINSPQSYASDVLADSPVGYWTLARGVSGLTNLGSLGAGYNATALGPSGWSA
jgi:parallel beta-helix repeat protein